MPRKKLTIGDVYQLKTPKGWAYLQFIQKPIGTAPMFRVLDVLASKPLSQEEIEQAVLSPERFTILLGILVAVRWKLAEYVCNIPLPDDYTPPRYRINDMRDLTGKWHIIDQETNESRRVDTLSEKQKQFPLDVIPAPDLLAERIASGWTPKDWYNRPPIHPRKQTS